MRYRRDVTHLFNFVAGCEVAEDQENNPNPNPVLCGGPVGRADHHRNALDDNDGGVHDDAEW